MDSDENVRVVLTRLGTKRSAWNLTDIRGQVEQLIAGAGVVRGAATRTELAEDLTARAVAASVAILQGGTPEHIRALTSDRVLKVEDRLKRSFAARAAIGGMTQTYAGGTFDPTQHVQAAAVLRKQFQQPRSPADNSDDLVRDLADYDRAFGLTCDGQAI